MGGDEWFASPPGVRHLNCGTSKASKLRTFVPVKASKSSTSAAGVSSFTVYAPLEPALRFRSVFGGGGSVNALLDPAFFPRYSVYLLY